MGLPFDINMLMSNPVVADAFRQLGQEGEFNEDIDRAMELSRNMEEQAMSAFGQAQELQNAPPPRADWGDVGREGFAALADAVQGGQPRYAPQEFQRTRDNVAGQLAVRKQRIEGLMAQYDERAQRAAKIGDLATQAKIEKDLQNLQNLHARLRDAINKEAEREENEKDRKAAMDRIRWQEEAANKRTAMQEAGANARASEATSRALSVEEARTSRMVSRVTQGTLWAATDRAQKAVADAWVQGMDQKKKRITPAGKSKIVVAYANARNSVKKIMPGESREDAVTRIKLFNQWMLEQPELIRNDKALEAAARFITYEEFLRATGMPENKIKDNVAEMESRYGPATAPPIPSE
jgi:hypothetical protein